MIFSSELFLTFFLPLFLIVYSILPKNYNLKHIFILLASFVFYAWGEPRFVFILFFATILDFFLVKMMDKQDDASKRKLFLALPILLNGGLLFYFKYTNFFVDNITGLFTVGGLQLDKVILPIGISFYTFESITYAVDVYRRVHKPLDRFWEYQMYIIFFPKLIAGPIVRYHEIADQISTHLDKDTADNRLHGFIRFCIGLAKKVLIANVLGAQADAIFNADLAHINTMTAWAGALAYSFQIYFDFSGYSDMAIGILRILGFRIPENFNNPYNSKSVTEFWRRWHITLGNWMKNYLYIPLGGNRAAKGRVLLNLMIVFLLSGFWHGANWNFILWGAYYGLFLIIERLVVPKGKANALRQILGWLYTFVVVVVGWVIFKNEDMGRGFTFLQKMFAFDFNHDYFMVFEANFVPILLVAAVFSVIALIKRVDLAQEKLFTGDLSKPQLVAGGLVAMATYFVCILFLSGGQYNPFIYFKF